MFSLRMISATSALTCARRAPGFRRIFARSVAIFSIPRTPPPVVSSSWSSARLRITLRNSLANSFATSPAVVGVSTPPGFVPSNISRRTRPAAGTSSFRRGTRSFPFPGGSPAAARARRSASAGDISDDGGGRDSNSRVSLDGSVAGTAFLSPRSSAANVPTASSTSWYFASMPARGSAARSVLSASASPSGCSDPSDLGACGKSRVLRSMDRGMWFTKAVTGTTGSSNSRYLLPVQLAGLSFASLRSLM